MMEKFLDKCHTQLGEMVKWQHFGPLHYLASSLTRIMNWAEICLSPAISTNLALKIYT